MAYAEFLMIFLGIPLIGLAWITLRDFQRNPSLPSDFRNLAPWGPLLIHVCLALVYTTPWDNYLVATGVWYYNPDLVAGVTLGWVPIEEYTFFVLQTTLTGLWLLFLIRRMTPCPISWSNLNRVRRQATLALGVLWLGSIALLANGWKPGTYLGLILVWALPPIMIQTAFGADLLWRHRRLTGLALFSMTLYLCASDSLAIEAGTWMIDPAQSTQIFLGGILPLEEFVFFFMTNTLIVFGMVLALATESRQRAQEILPARHFRYRTKLNDREYS